MYHCVMIMGLWRKYDVDCHYFIFAERTLTNYNNYILYDVVTITTLHAAIVFHATIQHVAVTFETLNWSITYQFKLLCDNKRHQSMKNQITRSTIFERIPMQLLALWICVCITTKCSSSSFVLYLMSLRPFCANVPFKYQIIRKAQAQATELKNSSWRVFPVSK